MTPEEFKKDFIREGKRLYSFAFRYLGVREEAEDVVQDVMMKIWEQRDTLGRYDNKGGLATTMTRNMCIDRLRKRKTITIYDLPQGTVTDMTSTGHPDDTAEASALAVGAIGRLKEPYKSAIIMRDLEGYSYEETADIMGVTVGNLRTIVARARKTVREELENIFNYGTGKTKGPAGQVL